MSSIITPEVISEVAKDPECQAALIPHLPKDQQTPEGLLENLRSAQFLQALHSLTAATQSEQIPALLSSFGLDPSVLHSAKDGLDAFLKAIIRQFGPK